MSCDLFTRVSLDQALSPTPAPFNSRDESGIWPLLSPELVDTVKHGLTHGVLEGYDGIFSTSATSTKDRIKGFACLEAFLAALAHEAAPISAPLISFEAVSDDKTACLAV